MSEAEDADNAALAALMRRVLADEELFVQVYQGWLTLDGGLQLSETEIEVVGRLRELARG